MALVHHSDIIPSLSLPRMGEGRISMNNSRPHCGSV